MAPAKTMCNRATGDDVQQSHWRRCATELDHRGRSSCEILSPSVSLRRNRDKSNQEDELRAENRPGEGVNEAFDTTKNETQHEELFEESEKAVGDGTAKIGSPEEAKDGKIVETAPIKLDIENQPDATNFKCTATKATTLIKEAKSSEIMLAQYEKAVSAVIDKAAAAEEAPAEKVSEIFEEVNEGLTHGTADTYEEKKEIASADTNNSENLIDNENRQHKSPEPACEGNGVTKGLNLKEHVEDLGSDAPVMVEASRDMDVKIAHKKSHNILSGVESKVKHSIAKVKKVITGKSSYPKTASPK